MPTFYSRSGLAIEIVRPTLSNFSGSYILGSNLFDFNSADTNLFLTTPGEAVFTFNNATASDPTDFRLLDYDTGEFITSVIFPSPETLTLVIGIEGESSDNLFINYPLQTFNFTNPEVIATWVCSPLPPGCGGIELTIADLPEPKIIGNLLGCSNEDFKGDITIEPVCNSEELGQYFLFQIRNKLTNELLYSRIECCCPIVSPGPPPGFVCTCPDWGKATSYNQTLFSSSVRLREWILSGAGARRDCKHIMAAKRIMGIDQPVYTDPPYAAPPPPSMPS